MILLETVSPISNHVCDQSLQLWKFKLYLRPQFCASNGNKNILTLAPFFFFEAFLVKVHLGMIYGYSVSRLSLAFKVGVDLDTKNKNMHVLNKNSNKRKCVRNLKTR